MARYDATDGDFPRHTLIANNVVREVGLWEKQSSAWFQAKAMQSTIRDNLFFNGPRAGINFNVCPPMHALHFRLAGPRLGRSTIGAQDGFGGGINISGNIMFNYCRDSGDVSPARSLYSLQDLTTEMFCIRC